MQKMSDEEIIKTRLINDGEGKNDGKRLNSLLKNFMASTISSSKTAEENQAEMNQLSAQIAACQARKEELLLSMIKEESEKYNKSSKELNEQIADAKRELASLYPVLEKAVEKHNAQLKPKMIINEIEKLPSVVVKMTELERLKKELDESREESAALDKRIEKARENYGALKNAWPDGEAVDIDDKPQDNAGAAVKSTENMSVKQFVSKQKFYKTHGKKNKESQE